MGNKLISDKVVVYTIKSYIIYHTIPFHIWADIGMGNYLVDLGSYIGIFEQLFDIFGQL